jgi:hypothetical protein
VKPLPVNLVAGFFLSEAKMLYQNWKTGYLTKLKLKIKSHKNSVNYSNNYIDELCGELLERGGFDENCGHWECVTAEQASQESLELWLEDYFEGILNND